MTDGPRRISDREVPLAITGYFIPTHAASAPVLVGMPGTDDLFVFAFSTEEMLREVMRSFDISYDRVACVTDGAALFAEIDELNRRGGRPYQIRIAVDPYKTPDGRARFFELLKDAAASSPSSPPSSASALSTMEHAAGCMVVRENGVAVWMCVGDCPAMYDFIRSGQVDHQPWDQLDPDQVATVEQAVATHALDGLRTRGDE